MGCEPFGEAARRRARHQPPRPRARSTQLRLSSPPCPPPVHPTRRRIPGSGHYVITCEGSQALKLAPYGQHDSTCLDRGRRRAAARCSATGRVLPAAERRLGIGAPRRASHLRARSGSNPWAADSQLLSRLKAFGTIQEIYCNSLQRCSATPSPRRAVMRDGTYRSAASGDPEEHRHPQVPRKRGAHRGVKLRLCRPR
ncbi:MAG: hypothetical protein JWM85_1287 [Acidimicrobiaceae bacterium]|nr:hypothetical protein [Acidimicrobiaceae bacterium]